MFLLIGVLIFTVFYLLERDDFQFKTLSANCENFTISRNIAYNKNKSAIYITNIKYCGGNDRDEYKEIECSLYETNYDITKKISSYQYQEEEKWIKLEDFLQNVTLSVDDYSSACREYSEDSLNLLINATNRENKVISYKVPLKLEDYCNS